MWRHVRKCQISQGVKFRRTAFTLSAWGQQEKPWEKEKRYLWLCSIDPLKENNSSVQRWFFFYLEQLENSQMCHLNWTSWLIFHFLTTKCPDVLKAVLHPDLVLTASCKRTCISTDAESASWMPTVCHHGVTTLNKTDMVWDKKTSLATQQHFILY